MFCTKFGTITKEGWERVDGIIDEGKLNSLLKELSVFERLVLTEVLCSNMNMSRFARTSSEEMQAEIEKRDLKKENKC